jgi:hypothetical protein
MTAKQKLHGAMRALLEALRENGNSAPLDQFSCLIARDRRKLPGSPEQWLKLIAGGYPRASTTRSC